MALPVKHLTADFSPGHDLAVRECEPRVGLCADGVEPAWDSLSPPLSALPRLLSFKNRQTLKKKNSKTIYLLSVYLCIGVNSPDVH